MQKLYEKMYLMSQLKNEMRQIDIAKNINFYESEEYFKLKDLLPQLIKKKYLDKYDYEIKLHTSISISNDTIYSIRVWGTKYINKGFKKLIEVEYDRHKSNQFSDHYLFETEVDLLENENNILINEYYSCIKQIISNLKKEMEKLIEKETEEYKLFYEKEKQYKILQKEVETILDEKLNKEENFLNLKSDLEKYIRFSYGFNIKTSIISNNEYDHSVRGGINFGIQIGIKSIYDKERVVSLLFDKNILYGSFLISFSKNTIEWENSLISNNHYLKNKIELNKYLKKKFPKKLENILEIKEIFNEKEKQ